MLQLYYSTTDLINDGFLKRKEDIAHYSILAWDMGRLVLIARLCADLSYISEGEAWKLVTQAYSMCKDVYKDWNEFAAGYVVGRAMFGGTGIMLDGVMEIAKQLLQDEESPWKNSTL